MTKSENVLCYIIKKLDYVGITKITKLVYFSDLWFMKHHKKQLTDYKYIRYYYWPYSLGLRADITNLISKGILRDVESELPNWETIIYYTVNKDTPIDHFQVGLSDVEIKYLDEVVSDLWKLAPNHLKSLSYKTAPMIVLGCTEWWKESWEEELDLSAIIK